jgi:hypothetical protein
VLANWRRLPVVDGSALLASGPIPIRRVQPGLLLDLFEVLAGGDAAPTWANLSLRNAAVGLGRPAAHALIVRWISLLHSEVPTRSKYAS